MINEDFKTYSSNLSELRIAICGKLDTACKALRQEGIQHIDEFSDAVELGFELRNGKEYHLVLVYAPQGEGLDTEMPYKIRCDGEWKKVPVKLLNEPACSSALIELKYAVWNIAKNQADIFRENSR